MMVLVVVEGVESVGSMAGVSVWVWVRERDIGLPMFGPSGLISGAFG